MLEVVAGRTNELQFKVVWPVKHLNSHCFVEKIASVLSPGGAEVNSQGRKPLEKGRPISH
jgi:hypothetical protein